VCGITAIYNKSGLTTEYLSKANAIIAHRGPDDEGYLLWRPPDQLQVFSGCDTAVSTQDLFNYAGLPPDRRDWLIGLGHRRLSIIDLSPNGHQPMVLSLQGLTVTFNGEIYNYIEIREELVTLGHQFHTSSDTEVILHAWAQWGQQALHKFNGMFAFVLLDTHKQKLYAVRDRFGVKPLYYSNPKGYLAFASEVKQLRELPGYQFKLNEQIAYDYLRYGLVDHVAETFEHEIYQLKPGHVIELDLASGQWCEKLWYALTPKSWKGSEHEACEQFHELLKDSVRLRMRSDVPVGSALSGGLDSSTIVCLMKKVLAEQGFSAHTIQTITSCSDDKKYDEWEFAEAVIKKVQAEPHKTFPSFEKLQQDFDRLLWHMDYPFGSTSQFSQWCVFEEAKILGLTVMIDGQGADEQLAGYGGNDMSFYAGLLGKGKLKRLWQESTGYKTRNGNWPYGFLLGALQIQLPMLAPLFPQHYQPLKQADSMPAWIKSAGYSTSNFTARSLQQNLLRQVQVLPLPSLLRYEDRNSMAFSVESRVPFMDYRLIEFTLGLPEELIYREGERKHILRKTFRGVVPDKILDRRDKMGFVSAEERWLKQEGRNWFQEQMAQAGKAAHAFIETGNAHTLLDTMQAGKTEFNFEPWRIICFGRWINR